MTNQRLKWAGLACVASMTLQTQAALTLNATAFNSSSNPNGLVSSQVGIGPAISTLFTAITALNGSGNPGTVYTVVRDVNLAIGGNQPVEVGPLATSYDVSFSPSNGTGTAQTIFVGDPVNGNWAQATQLRLYSLTAARSWTWNLSGWDGREAINIPDMTVGVQGVTIVEIYGTVVPEPSTYAAAALLALPILAQVRRMRAKSAKSA